MSLISRQSALAWDLRGFLWSGKEVVVLSPGADLPRVRGLVIGVTPTDALALIDDARWDEPVAIDLSGVASVRQPHYHEEGDAPLRTREVFERHRGPEPLPGQLSLGAQRVPEVSTRSRIAMAKAAGMLLSQDLLDVLGALDKASRGRESVLTGEVAEAMVVSIDGEQVRGKPSPQWTVRKLAFLADLRLVLVEEGRRYRWSPGD